MTYLSVYYQLKRPFLLLLCGLLLLLAACGGEEATAVPPTATPQPTAVPPTATPQPTAVPPTHTPIPPTATPDISADFDTFTDESERVTFQYPPNWKLDTEEQTNDAFVFILTSGEDVFDLLGAEDFSQPLGFAIGEIRWAAFFGSDDPSLILADWVEESGLDMSLPGEVSLWEQGGVNFASQDFEAVNDSGDTLLLTATVIVNGGRYGTFAFGATAVGADDYAGLAQAIFDSTVVHYLDPAAELPDQTADVLPTPAPQEVAVEIIVVDFADPASVLQAVFDSARLGDYSQLAGLCDPQGENDSDTAAICEITADHANKDLFIEFFAQGRINGDLVIDSNTAQLPFLFGPDGDQEETMNFIQRDGRWYLLEF